MMIVILAVCSSFLIQLGYFLWKTTLHELPQVGRDKIHVVLKGFLTHPKWLLGMFLRLAGLALFIKATHLGPISLVQPLMSIGDLFLLFLAYVFLHERLGRIEWWGIFLIIIGAVIIALEAEVTETVPIDWFHIILFVTVAALSLVTLIILGMRTRFGEICLSVAVGVEFGISSILSKTMTSQIALNGHPVNVMTCVLNPIFPFIILSNITGLVILQMAFQRGRAAVVLPTQLSVVNGVAILGGIFLFSETVSMIRLGGMILVIMGTYLIGQAAARKEALQNKGNL